MKLTVLGVGGAGCRLAARLQQRELADRPYVVEVRAFDTDPATLDTLDLPEESRRLFHPEPDTADDVGIEATRPDGDHSDDDRSDGNRSDGGGPDAAAVRAGAEANLLELRRVASDAVTAETDGVLLVAGLGGATGAGAAPVLADALGEFHDLPMYALSVLPAEGEPAPAAANAAAGLRRLEAAVDSQLLFDDGLVASVEERPETPEAALEAYDDANDTIAEWVSLLFDAGEASGQRGVGERVLDTSELVATLGESGYTMLGYRRERVREPPSLMDRLLSRSEEIDSVERYSTIETAVRRALFRHRSVDPEGVLETTERALLVAAGPPDWLDREALADGRRLLTEETDGAVVRGADTPVPEGTDLQVLVVCAGLNRPARVAALLSEDDD